MNLEASAVLRELRSVESLRLVKCQLTDRWLTQLCHSGGSSKWRGVRLLDLSKNQLTHACCSALCAVLTGALEVLILDGNRIHAQGFEMICSTVNTTTECALRWLSIADNNIGHPGGFTAASFLEHTGGCPLRVLRLACNPQLTNSELVAVLRAVCRQNGKMGKQLELLDLSLCGVQPSLAQPVAKALSQCPQLTIDVRGGLLANPSCWDVHTSGIGRAAGLSLLDDLARFARIGRVCL